MGAYKNPTSKKKVGGLVRYSSKIIVKNQPLVESECSII